MERVLITGASSGIGLAIAEEFARRGHPLVLVARNELRLCEVAEYFIDTYAVDCEIFAADIVEQEALDRVQHELVRQHQPIDILVNNAGVGLPDGGYLGNPVQTTSSMNLLNIDAVFTLAHSFVPVLMGRGHGGIITVASIAGFYPGTAAITYSASKSWAIAFGEGLHTFLQKTGVRSTTVAPGFVRSEFHRRAGIAAEGIPDSWWLSPAEVARATVNGYEKRKSLVVPGLRWKVWYATFSKLPRTYGRHVFASLMKYFEKRLRKPS